MRTIRVSVLMAAFGLACFGQQWEFGGGAGAGFLPGVSVTSPVGSATTGFQSGVSAGAYAGQSLNAHISGEIRYEFMQSNLKLQSGGTDATFSGQAHLVHYDVLWHTSRKGSRTQYFVAVGGGMKIFNGTGQEAAYQPLSQYGYFTKTHVTKPMGDVGAGIKYALTPRLILRTEIRDFITPFPDKLIAPAPGAKFGSILHDFVPMVSIGYIY